MEPSASPVQLSPSGRKLPNLLLELPCSSSVVETLKTNVHIYTGIYSPKPRKLISQLSCGQASLPSPPSALHVLERERSLSVTLSPQSSRLVPLSSRYNVLSHNPDLKVDISAGNVSNSPVGSIVDGFSRNSSPLGNYSPLHVTTVINSTAPLDDHIAGNDASGSVFGPPSPPSPADGHGELLDDVGTISTKDADDENNSSGSINNTINIDITNSSNNNSTIIKDNLSLSIPPPSLASDNVVVAGSGNGETGISLISIHPSMATPSLANPSSLTPPSIPSSPSRKRAVPAGSSISIPVKNMPPVLAFETWWREMPYNATVHIFVLYDTVTNECLAGPKKQLLSAKAHIATGNSSNNRNNSNNSISNSGNEGSGDGSRGRNDINNINKNNSTTNAINISYRPITAWDLHVGAEIQILGRKVTLKKAADRVTLEWLDSQASALLQMKHRLDLELSKFRLLSPIKMQPHIFQRCEALGSETHLQTPSGGRLNLAALLALVRDLAEELRRHRQVLPPLVVSFGGKGGANGSNTGTETTGATTGTATIPTPAKATIKRTTTTLTKEEIRMDIKGPTTWSPERVRRREARLRQRLRWGDDRNSFSTIHPAAHGGDLDPESIDLRRPDFIDWIQSIPLASSAAGMKDHHNPHEHHQHNEGADLMHSFLSPVAAAVTSDLHLHHSAHASLHQDMIRRSSTLSGTSLALVPPPAVMMALLGGGGGMGMINSNNGLGNNSTTTTTTTTTMPSMSGNANVLLNNININMINNANFNNSSNNMSNSISSLIMNHNNLNASNQPSFSTSGGAGGRGMSYSGGGPGNLSFSPSQSGKAEIGFGIGGSGSGVGSMTGSISGLPVLTRSSTLTQTSMSRATPDLNWDVSRLSSTNVNMGGGGERGGGGVSVSGNAVSSLSPFTTNPSISMGGGGGDGGGG